VQTSTEVDAWFEAFEHPLKDAMLRVRKEILSTDRRMGECIKWKSPTFTFEGNMASIDPRVKKYVQLMFHQGAALPGDHPALEGGGGTVRYLRFADLADVRAKRHDLRAAVKSWIELRTHPG